MNHKDFLNGQKTFRVAPAGYGKTHAIAQYLEKHEAGKQLILTHTHAGVSSIKEKIKNLEVKVPSNSYSVETISSFTQKYVASFYCGDDIPDQDKKDRRSKDGKKVSDGYHSFIAKKILEIMDISYVQDVVKISYSRLFVDEYQDCSVRQHELIMKLSNLVPTHIFGDHMQAIFDFNEELNDFPNSLLEHGFERFPDFDTPYRWNNAGRSSLGSELGIFRNNLEEGKVIDLKPYEVTIDDSGNKTLPVNKGKRIFSFFLEKPDYFHAQSDSDYKEILQKIVKENESLLIIMSEYRDKEGKQQGLINQRNEFRKVFRYNKLVLLESIDGKSFYDSANKIDSIIAKIPNNKKPIKFIFNELEFFIAETNLKEWVSWKVDKEGKKTTDDYYFKRKTKKPDIQKSAKLKDSFNLLISSPSIRNFSNILRVANKEKIMKFKSLRPELLKSLSKSMKEASISNISVYEAMKNHRNLIRRIGRGVDGRCIGTTLLTKGLEFDTVVILDAHKFDCPKNLYVALTRCCKNLIIFSDTKKLSFQKKKTAPPQGFT